MERTEGEHAVCEILSHSRFILDLTGFWPEKCMQKSRITKIKSSLMLILYGLIMSFNIIMMLINYDDTSEFIPNMFRVVTMMNSILRIFWLVIRKNSILESIEKSGSFLSIERTLKASSIMENWQSRAAKIVKWSTRIVILFLIGFCIFPIILQDRNLPTSIDLPTYIRDTRWFYLIYFTDVILCSIGVGAFLTEEIFLIFFVTNLCGELECIALEMKKFERDTSSSFIRNTIENHVVAIAHGNEISQLVSTILYMEIVTGVMIVCSSGFTVLLSINTAITGNALAVLFISVIRIFMIFFFGEMLSDMSLQVHEAVTNTAWYCCNEKDKKAIQLILLQAQRPLQLRVGTLGILNLRGFGIFIFHWYSIMTVLNKVIEY